MKITVITTIAVMFVGGLCNAVAGEIETASEAAASWKEEMRVAQHHHHREFLGCVQNAHQCSHLAEGFDHYQVNHDDSCGHPHLACYGIND